MSISPAVIGGGRKSYHHCAANLHVVACLGFQCVLPARIHISPLILHRLVPYGPMSSRTLAFRPILPHATTYRPIPYHSVQCHLHFIPCYPIPPHLLPSHVIPSDPIPSRTIPSLPIGQASVRRLRIVHVAIRGGVGLPRLGEAAGVQGLERGGDRGRHRSSWPSCCEGGEILVAVAIAAAAGVAVAAVAAPPPLPVVVPRA